MFTLFSTNLTVPYFRDIALSQETLAPVLEDGKPVFCITLSTLQGLYTGKVVTSVAHCCDLFSFPDKLTSKVTVIVTVFQVGNPALVLA